MKKNRVLIFIVSIIGGITVNIFIIVFASKKIIPPDCYGWPGGSKCFIDDRGVGFPLGINIEETLNLAYFKLILDSAFWIIVSYLIIKLFFYLYKTIKHV